MTARKRVTIPVEVRKRGVGQNTQGAYAGEKGECLVCHRFVGYHNWSGFMARLMRHKFQGEWCEGGERCW